MRDEDGYRIEDETVSYRAVTRFEDLVAWQRARDLTIAVYRLTRETGLATDRDLARQMRRSAVSIMSNIAEGYERGSTREYFRFLSIAKASCAELWSQLHVAIGVGHIDQQAFTRLMAQAEEVARILGALRSSIGRHLNAGPRQS
jgi:four helix bundle protein